MTEHLTPAWKYYRGLYLDKHVTLNGEPAVIRSSYARDSAIVVSSRLSGEASWFKINEVMTQRGGNFVLTRGHLATNPQREFHGKYLYDLYTRARITDDWIFYGSFSSKEAAEKNLVNRAHGAFYHKVVKRRAYFATNPNLQDHYHLFEDKETGTRALLKRWYNNRWLLTRAGKDGKVFRSLEAARAALNKEGLIEIPYRPQGNPILETLGASLLTGVGLGAGFSVAKKLFNHTKDNPDKEPWEMTKDEWVKQQGKKVNGQSVKKTERLARLLHRHYVKIWISEGKSVSPEVLAMYPEFRSNPVNYARI